jgi:hypothetical protein
MNFLNKNLSAFIFFIFATNPSFAKSPEARTSDLEEETTVSSNIGKDTKSSRLIKREQEVTTSSNSKTPADSLSKRICSKISNVFKSGTNFVKNNPKKCIIIAAAIIAATILYWHLNPKMPSKTWEQMQAEDEYNLYKIFSECPNNKALEEAMINLKKNHVKIDYTKKPATPIERCIYHDAGNQSIRYYCDPARKNDNAQNIHLMPAEIDYIYEHGNEIVRRAIDYLKSRATQYCQGQ